MDALAGFGRVLFPWAAFLWLSGMSASEADCEFCGFSGCLLVVVFLFGDLPVCWSLRTPRSADARAALGSAETRAAFGGASLHACLFAR